MFANWSTPPCFTPYPLDRADWLVLVEDWSVNLGEFHKLIVPKGFITDGPSVPWIVQPITPVTGHNRIPATIHDALYAIQGGGVVTRAETDRLFFDALGPSFRHRLIWLGVRIGGLPAWDDESEVDVLNTARGTLPKIMNV